MKHKKTNTERAGEIFKSVAHQIDIKLDNEMSELSHAEALEKLSAEEKAKWFKVFVQKNGTNELKKKYWVDCEEE